MNTRIVSGIAVGALAAVTALVAVGGGAGAASGPSVTGGGAGSLDSDRVHVQLSARGAQGATHGRFNIVHHTPDGIFAHLAGDIDCLAISGPTAVLTGTITEGFDDLGIDPVGERISLAIHDQETDSLDMDVSFVSGHAISPCSAQPIFTVTVDDGPVEVRT
jgi:hypothetical protein